jgi:hypothetical protein
MQQGSNQQIQQLHTSSSSSSLSSSPPSAKLVSGFGAMFPSHSDEGAYAVRYPNNLEALAEMPRYYYL